MAYYEYECIRCSWWDDAAPPPVGEVSWMVCPQCDGDVIRKIVLDPGEIKDFNENRED